MCRGGSIRYKSHRTSTTFTGGWFIAHQISRLDFYVLEVATRDLITAIVENNEAFKKQDASDHLANERTFLAWLRTGIGVMAFGFVVVKFSLFVRQISIALGKPTVQYGYSVPIGIILVAFGALCLLFSLLRYEKTKRQLLKGEFEHTSGFLYFIVSVILLMSIILIVYLVKTT